jgi:hypothetical protein
MLPKATEVREEKVNKAVSNYATTEQRFVVLRLRLR